MTMKRVMTEIGMGTDIRGTDYTKAAVRALRDALWHNSLNVAAALGKETDSMFVEVYIGVPKPERVNKEEVLAVLPHGTGTVTVRKAVSRSSTTRARARPSSRMPRRSCGSTWLRRQHGAEESHTRARDRQRSARRGLHEGGGARSGRRAASLVAERRAHARSRPQQGAGRSHDRRAEAREGRYGGGQTRVAARSGDGESRQGRARRARGRPARSHRDRSRGGRGEIRLP